MIKVEYINVMNFDGATRGLRNPLESWDKSDSDWYFDYNQLPINFSPINFNFNNIKVKFRLGKEDLKLMHKLISAGEPNDKFMRQILCSMQITAPLYWWKEMDTYKIGTTANSTSTMHKIHSRSLKENDFSLDFYSEPTDIEDMPLDMDKPFDIDSFSFDIDSKVLPQESIVRIKHAYKTFIEELEWLRIKYLETKDQMPEDNPYWRALIQLLPESYNQKREWTANYCVLRHIYKWRRNHKLSEWRDFCKLFLNEECFPYGKELIAYEPK